MWENRDRPTALAEAKARDDMRTPTSFSPKERPAASRLHETLVLPTRFWLSNIYDRPVAMFFGFLSERNKEWVIRGLGTITNGISQAHQPSLSGLILPPASQQAEHTLHTILATFDWLYVN